MKFFSDKLRKIMLKRLFTRTLGINLKYNYRDELSNISSLTIHDFDKMYQEVREMYRGELQQAKASIEDVSRTGEDAAVKLNIPELVSFYHEIEIEAGTLIDKLLSAKNGLEYRKIVIENIEFQEWCCNTANGILDSI